MTDMHATERTGNDAPADAIPETPTNTIDGAQAAEGSHPNVQPPPLNTEALFRLHPRLWGPVWSDPQLAAKAEELALEIVHEDSFADVLALVGDTAARAELMTLARNVAEPQIGLRRVWRAQHELQRGLSGKDFHGEPPSFGVLMLAAKLQPRKPSAQVILAIYHHGRRLDVQQRKAKRAFDAAVHRHQRRVFGLTNRLQRQVDNRGNKANVA